MIMIHMRLKSQVTRRRSRKQVNNRKHSLMCTHVNKHMWTSVLGYVFDLIGRMYVCYTLVLVYTARISFESSCNHDEQWFCSVYCLSSEDELDILLNGTPEQKKKLVREYLTGESESSSGDEFEKEMEAELSSTMKRPGVQLDGIFSARFHKHTCNYRSYNLNVTVNKLKLWFNI